MKILIAVSKTVNNDTHKLLARYTGRIHKQGSLSNVYELSLDDPDSLTYIQSFLGEPLRPKYKVGDSVIILKVISSHIEKIDVVEVNGKWGFLYKVDHDNAWIYEDQLQRKTT